MSHYFSQLMQQTGIQFGYSSESSTDAVPLNRGSAPMEMDSGLQVEEVEVTVPQPELLTPSMFEPSAANPSGESLAEPISSHSESVPSERSQAASTPAPQLKRTAPPPPVEQPESIILEQIEIRQASEIIPASPEPTNRASRPAESPASPGVSPDRPQSNTDAAIASQETPVERNVPPAQAPVQIRQAYWQAVQDWVAAPPVRVRENRESSIDPSELNPVLEQSEARPFSPPVASHLPQHIETQDLILSIGTISLTVEEPQREIRQPQPTRSRPEPPARPAHPSSRLSRHYLRAR